MKIGCGEDNLKTFTETLKKTTLEFYGFLKRLYAKGLIDGMRGVTLETPPYADNKADDGSQVAISRVCGDCAHYQQFAVGSGSGFGKCLIEAMSLRLNWPHSIACQKLKEL